LPIKYAEESLTAAGFLLYTIVIKKLMLNLNVGAEQCEAKELVYICHYVVLHTSKIQPHTIESKQLTLSDPLLIDTATPVAHRLSESIRFLHHHLGVGSENTKKTWYF
jgi:hypothetical protein